MNICKEVGSKHKVRYALTRLMKEGKVKRVIAFRIDGIGYLYEDYNNMKNTH